MTWDELRTRIIQEVSKKLDLALYRTGLGMRGPRLQLQAATQPKFFFDTFFSDTKKDEAADRAALVRAHLPRDADAILHEADNICRYQFHLLGYEKVDYGTSIDWHFDPVHQKRSPLRPWPKINFLDFNAVGDHKVIWELNRHQHLVTLAKAWRLSGNSAYAKEVVAQFYSWQQSNPYPLGINWASTLEVAFRSMSWLWVRNLLAGCPDVPANFHADILLALQSHGRYIERYLSTYFSPNTHLLGEAIALFFIGTLCPEIAAAERWRKRGWNIVLEESARQVRSDGVYFEQALYYHVYALDFFLQARLLASQNGVAIPEPFDNVLKKMLDVLQAISESGPLESFGDDDGGRVFNPRRNQVECLTDPLALGAALYDCDKYAIAGVTEEAIWLLGDRAVKIFTRPRALAPAASKAFAAGGIYLIQDDEPCTEQMTIDAGPQGTGSSGHGHADALSVRFSVDGRRLLIDPGTYCYICEGDERNWFRGTGAHNTLRVDGLDQAVPEGPFAWSSIPNVRADAWLTGRTFDFFAGSHDGYRRLPRPALHRRFVFHVKGGLWLVRDVVEGEGTHLLETFWHFAPDVEVTEERGIVFAESAHDAAKQQAALALLINLDTNGNSTWTTEFGKGSVSPAYGSKQDAPVVRVSANAKLPAECAALLLPMVKPSEAGTFSAIGESFVPGVHGYRYQTSSTTEFTFFADGNTPWTCGLWASDAKLLYCKLESGRFTHVIMVSGSFGEWRGKRFVSLQSTEETFEWVSRSKGNATEDSAIKDFEIFDPVS
jgi:Heparinase II/III-like protein/Heparinase II/III N-terminus